jgi:hypothetical protein
MNSVYSVLRTFGQFKANELMSRHTTFKIGGPVDYFCSINKTENVIKALHYLDALTVDAHRPIAEYVVSSTRDRALSLIEKLRV